MNAKNWNMHQEFYIDLYIQLEKEDLSILEHYTILRLNRYKQEKPLQFSNYKFFLCL
jgi:hypothetical protein